MTIAKRSRERKGPRRAENPLDAVVLVRVSEAMAERITALAEAQDYTRGIIARQLLDKGLAAVEEKGRALPKDSDDLKTATIFIRMTETTRDRIEAVAQGVGEDEGSGGLSTTVRRLLRVGLGRARG